MEGYFLLDRRPRPWHVVMDLLRLHRGLMDTPDSMTLPLRDGDLGGFIRGISPYAGHFFQQFRLFGLRDCKRRQQAIIKKQKY